MGRFRQTKPFAAVSPRERRNADLFFADLVGRGSPASSLSAQNAELFFEALEGWQGPRALLPAGGEAEAPDPVPAPTVTETKNVDEIIVTRADGTRFRVRRKNRVQAWTNPGRLRTGFCSDDKRVLFRMAWCQGTQGKIDFGANAQGALQKLLTDVMGQINRGESLEEIKKTIENAPVQAFLDLDIKKFDTWTITGGVKLDLNQNGIASTTAKLSFDKRWIKVGAEVTVGPDGKQILVTGEIPLSKPKITGKECPGPELAIWWDAECLREVPTYDQTKTMKDAIPTFDTLYLFFEHAMVRLRRDPGAPKPTDELLEILKSDPKAGTARRNKRSLERLENLIRRGYWLEAVEGYASPEGRRRGPDPGDRGPGADWEGNDALARRRAAKVLTLLDERYRKLKTMTQFRDVTPRFGRDHAHLWPAGAGLSEKPKLNDAIGREIEGDALDRILIFGKPGNDSTRVLPFLTENPKELERMTIEDQKFVTDPNKTPRQRAERLFENLRRVEIRLRKNEPLHGATFKDAYLEYVHPCPNDVIEAAERHWGSRIPLRLTKPDPPLCG